MDAVNAISFDGSKILRQKYSAHDKDVVCLEEKLENVKDKQGFIGNIWNGFKEITTLGTSANDCANMLEKYRSGEISFEQAVEYIDSFESKQENAKGLISNILTGIGAIAATNLIGASWYVAGTAVGAVTKTCLNLADRATNKVEGDEFNVKTITKDALSGAITGATSAVSSGVSKGIKAGNFGLSVRNGVKCGVACGAASGAGSYIIDTAFDEDKKFNFDEMVNQSLTSAFVSGTVGAAVGAGMYGTAHLTGTVGKEVAKSTSQTIVQDSATSSTRKVLANIERNIIKA